MESLLYWPFSNERVALNLVSLSASPYQYLFVNHGVKNNKVFSMCIWVFIIVRQHINKKSEPKNLIYEYALKNGHDVEKILLNHAIKKIIQFLIKI